MLPCRLRPFLLLFAIAPLALASPASAYWPADGRPVGIVGSLQQNPTLASDGAGGAIVFWTDNRSVTTLLSFHHVKSDGKFFAGVPVNGLQYNKLKTSGMRLTAVSDGAGGAYAVWQEQVPNSTLSQVFAIRMGPTGGIVAGWPDSALTVSAATHGSGAGQPVACSDGAGGLLIAWQQADADSFGSNNIWATRLTGAGAPATGWVSGGKLICAAGNNQSQPLIVSDGSTGAIISWQDLRAAVPAGTSPIQIYAQHVSGAGVSGWTADGVSVYTGATSASDVAMLADASSGAILSYSVIPASSYDLFAQRLDSGGTRQWGAGGVTVCSAILNQNAGQLASDGGGGAIIAWQDTRTNGVGGSQDIFARRITSAGSASWTADGVALCTATGPQEFPKVVADLAGGAIVIWPDYRTNNFDLYAQRVNSGGSPQWTADGVALCLSHNVDPTRPIVAIPDGSGGALVVWADNRAQPGIYMAKVNNFGVTGPSAVALGDVSAEETQGRIVVGWSAFLDAGARFQVVRRDSDRGAYAPVSGEIDGASGRADFQWIDTRVRPSTEYYYKIAYRQGQDWNYSSPVRVLTSAGRFSLRCAGPNPTAGDVRLEYQVPVSCEVILQVLNLEGRVVRTLLSGRVEAGTASTIWDGRSEDGRHAPAGIYFGRLRRGATHSSTRVVLLP